MCVYLNCSLGVRDWIREIIKYCASLQRQVGTQQRLRLREFGIVRQLLTGPQDLLAAPREMTDRMYWNLVMMEHVHSNVGSVQTVTV